MLVQTTFGNKYRLCVLTGGTMPNQILTYSESGDCLASVVNADQTMRQLILTIPTTSGYMKHSSNMVIQEWISEEGLFSALDGGGGINSTTCPKQH